jgi:hypothetical protein
VLSSAGDRIAQEPEVLWGTTPKEVDDQRTDLKGKQGRHRLKCRSGVSCDGRSGVEQRGEFPARNDERTVRYVQEALSSGLFSSNDQIVLCQVGLCDD